MPTLIVTTKLFVPHPLPDAVPRTRLLDRLNDGVHRKLTLISAPAGFGKSTLVSAWVAHCACATAWLSLDDRDNEITRFLAYLIAALATIRPAIGERELRALHAPQPPPAESILSALVNELADAGEFILVLDDYHVIDSKPIDDALAFLLDHLPAQVHLVITTREDPRLPLARLRARGQMNELRAADLRFDHAEAADFLTRVMGCTLTEDEIAALEVRTEGWIAGLQLAALSMRGRADVHGFVQAFAGDNRYIVDYLVDEVLQHQTEDARRFLLQTSMLDRLCGPLCDAVTDLTGGSARLVDLDRSNLFVIPLDDRRHWFRYHQLFADVLRVHLLEESPQEVNVLHRRASAWYAQNGQPATAIQHALAAEDYAGAAALIECAWPQMDATFQTAAWLGWAQTLPTELVRARPVLSAAYAWALLNNGRLEEAEARLQDAERWLAADAEANDPAGMIVADEEQFRTLAAMIATGRAFFAQAHGNVAATVDYGRHALALLPPDDFLRRGIAAALLGVAYLSRSDLELAHRTLAAGMADLRTAGNVLFALRGTYVLADIRLAQGRLRDAIRTYEQALQLAAEHGEHVLRGAADLHLRLSELYREQDNQRAAREHFQRSAALGEPAASPFWRYRQCLARARICAAEGELDGALRLLDEAGQLYVRGPVPELRPIAALKARVWIAQGETAAALAWARAAGLAADDEPDYLREFEHVTLARALIAAFRQERSGTTLRDALGLLERLLHAAEAGGRMGSALELLILEALARAAQNDVGGVLEPLRRALDFAAPEGYVRIFADEGQPMAQLLAAAAERGIMPDYTRKLLAACAADAQRTVEIAPRQNAVLHPALIEPLSPRELEVLSLVAQGLSNRDIADRLYLALSTVKGHNRVIFEKLQVQRRTEAVARARELGLL